MPHPQTISHVSKVNRKMKEMYQLDVRFFTKEWQFQKNFWIVDVQKICVYFMQQIE